MAVNESQILKKRTPKKPTCFFLTQKHWKELFKRIFFLHRCFFFNRDIVKGKQCVNSPLLIHTHSISDCYLLNNEQFIFAQIFLLSN